MSHSGLVMPGSGAERCCVAPANQRRLGALQANQGKPHSDSKQRLCHLLGPLHAVASKLSMEGTCALSARRHSRRPGGPQLLLLLSGVAIARAVDGGGKDALKDGQAAKGVRAHKVDPAGARNGSQLAQAW